MMNTNYMNTMNNANESINLKDLVKEFIDFIETEQQYLNQVKRFLVSVPEQMIEGKINQVEFHGFFEKYEVQNAHIIYEKNRFKERIASKLNVKSEYVTFSLLSHIGFKEFDQIGRNVLKTTNEISMLLVKISVYLKNFSQLQNEFKRFNNSIYPQDYTHRGTVGDRVYRPGRSFYGEA